MHTHSLTDPPTHPPTCPLQVADFIDRAVKIAQECKAATPAPGKLKEFGAYLAGEGAARADVQQLRGEVEAFARGFPMPGL